MINIFNANLHPFPITCSNTYTVHNLQFQKSYIIFCISTYLPLCIFSCSVAIFIRSFCSALWFPENAFPSWRWMSFILFFLACKVHQTLMTCHFNNRHMDGDWLWVSTLFLPWVLLAISGLNTLKLVETIWIWLILSFFLGSWILLDIQYT